MTEPKQTAIEDAARALRAHIEYPEAHKHTEEQFQQQKPYWTDAVKIVLGHLESAERLKAQGLVDAIQNEINLAIDHIEGYQTVIKECALECYNDPETARLVTRSKNAIGRNTNRIERLKAALTPYASAADDRGNGG